MKTNENIKELLDNMPATINVNGVIGILTIRKFKKNYYLTYSAEYMGDDNMPLNVEVANGREYAISTGDTLEECLIDLKERIKTLCWLD